MISEKLYQKLSGTTTFKEVRKANKLFNELKKTYLLNNDIAIAYIYKLGKLHGISQERKNKDKN